MNPQDWTVLAVTGAKEWSGKHGPMIDYYVDLEGYSESATLTQKPETDEPRVGDTIYGHIEVLDRKKRDGSPFTVHKLRKDQRDGEWQSQKSEIPKEIVAPGGPFKLAPNGDNRSARIERQHSQEMALRAITLHKAANLDLGQIRGIIEDWTDWFCADLDKHASSHGSQQNTSSSKPVTTPASTGTGGDVESPPIPVPDDEAARLCAQAAGLPEDRVALELVSAGARDISDISKAIRSLSAAEASKFAASLDDIADEQKHVAVGVADDDDIPF